MANYYVDSAASGANNGTSWVNAWTALPTGGVGPNDTVWISGGPAGTTKTYNRSDYWVPPAGMLGARVSFRISRERGHNGTAIFNRTAGNQTFMTALSHVNFSGDGGDGLCHIKFTNFGEVISFCDNYRLSYLQPLDTLYSFATGSAAGGTPAANIEIDHCRIKLFNMTADRAIYAASSVATNPDPKNYWIHDNYFELPRLSAGYGADGVQMSNSGFTFTNNVFVGYEAAYTGGQHQDGIQSQGAQNVVIYGNTFLNLSNYAVYMEAFYGGYKNVSIFNNTAIIDNAGTRAGSPGGFIIGIAGQTEQALPVLMSDLLIANNAVVGYPTADQSCNLSISNPGDISAIWINCRIINNLFVAGANNFGTQHATVTSSNNIYRSAAQAATDFYGYTVDGGLELDLRLRKTATSLIGAGLNLNADFTVDGDGRTRGSSWDVGPYQQTFTGRIYFCDKDATGTGDGLSWKNAATSIAAALGVSPQQPGDVMFISGGFSGSSKNYVCGEISIWPGMTYTIGRGLAHRGLAIFDGNGGSQILSHTQTNVIVSGDAGDGVRHFKFTNAYTMCYGPNWSHTRVSYVDCSDLPGQFSFNPATYVELDHCHFRTGGAGSNAISYGQFNDLAYDANKFHHNLVELQHVDIPTPSGGNGTDGLEWVGAGVSIYDNVFISYLDVDWNGNQHADGWQGSGGEYIKIYNNVFINIKNYAIFMEPSVGAYSHVRIYNNIAWTDGETQQAWALAANSSKPATDVIAANNLAVGYTLPLTFRDPDGPNGAAFINCKAFNNLGIATTQHNIIDDAVQQAGNVHVSNAQAQTRFRSYRRADAINDYNITAAALELIGQGTSVASEFTTDLAGNARVLPWDVGPYGYNLSPPVDGEEPPPVEPPAPTGIFRALLGERYPRQLAVRR